MTNDPNRPPSLEQVRSLQKIERTLKGLIQSFSNLGENTVEGAAVRFVWLCYHLPNELGIPAFKDITDAAMNGDVNLFNALLRQAQDEAARNPRCPYETFKRNYLRQQELQSKVSKTDAELQEFGSLIAWGSRFWKKDPWKVE
jgi:hypothetical protein